MRAGVETQAGEDQVSAMVDGLGVVMVESVESGGDDLGDGAAHVIGHVLGQASQSQALLSDDFAFVGDDLAFQDPQEGALALAIAAQEADAFTTLDLERDLIEKKRATERVSDVAKAEQGHGLIQGSKEAS